MKGLDPRLRQRVEVVPVRPTVRADVSNTELFESWKRSAKIGKSAIKRYGSTIQEAIRYFVTPEGAEIPVRKWAKTDVWAYVHHVEQSFCSNFVQICFKEPIVAKCRAKRWKGTKPAEEALLSDCQGCPSFKHVNARIRLHALDKWFSYLARAGVVPVNFVRDVVHEWYEENPKYENGSTEKKRNPTLEEVVKLVNGTTHPRNRALYATSAKWWCRPNEMLWLDRYASFGLPTPAPLKRPFGFEQGFAKHPEVPSYEAGGDLVYIPEKRDEANNVLADKRKGNRWLVVDGELRPILDQYLAWWEVTVQRNENGVPKTSAFMLTNAGTPILPDETGAVPSGFNEKTFYSDAIRLGLMREEDVGNPERRWAGHCQRHFGERVRQLYNVPQDWSNHFRGDAFKDARGDYFKPEPLVVRAKYLEMIPHFGFTPLPGTKRVPKTEKDRHREALRAEKERALAWKEGTAGAVCVRIHAGAESWRIPRRIAPSVKYALGVGRMGAEVQIVPEPGYAQSLNCAATVEVLDAFLGMLT